MTKLVWNKAGERYFETGVDRGVLYTNDVGVAWNGLVSVSENPSGGEATPYYLDGVKYLDVSGPEDFGLLIEAFTYPDEFSECDGTAFDSAVGFTMQPRKQFNLSYRTRVGNDTRGADLGYKVHMIYNALAAPSQRTNTTLNDSPEAMTFSWDVSTTPIRFEGRRPTAHLIIDSTKTTPIHMEEFEYILYGSDNIAPRFLTPSELVTLFGADMFEIVPSTATGLALLNAEIEERDLRGDPDDGVYTETIQTSLQETETPGLYVVQEN